MNKIFLIATDEFAGYEDGTTDEKTIRNVHVHLGYWTDKSVADGVCERLNREENINNEDNEIEYYVVEVEGNK